MAVMTTKNSGLMGGGSLLKMVKLWRDTLVDEKNGEKRVASAGEKVELPHYLAAELCEMGRASEDLDSDVPILEYQREQMAAKKAAKN